MSDLEARLRAIYGASPFITLLNPRFDLHGDVVTAVVPFHERLVGNPLIPSLHGGMLAAIAEITASAQLFVSLELEHLPKPIDVSINYLRMGRPREVYARASLTRQGSRIAHVEARAWQESHDRPITTLHGHFLIPKEGARDERQAGAPPAAH